MDRNPCNARLCGFALSTKRIGKLFIFIYDVINFKSGVLK